MKPRLLSTARLSFPLATALAALLAAPSAHAAAITWTGVDTGTWNTAGNWSPSGIPGILDDLTILGPSNLAGALTINFNAANSAKSLNFTNTAATNITNTTSGADKILTLGSGGITTGTGAVQIGSTTANQAVNITLGAAQAWNVGAGGLTVTNLISGLSTGITKTGAGTLTLNGAAANTFTGGIAVNGGTLLLDFVNRGAAPQNLVATQVLTLGGGGTLSVNGVVTNTAQSFTSFTLAAGGGIVNNNPNGLGLTTNVNLGAITATAAGGSLQFTRGTGNGNINTTNTNDATGILSGRMVNGIAGATTPNWAINSGTAATGTGASGNTIGSYATASYATVAALTNAAQTATQGVTSNTSNSRITFADGGTTSTESLTLTGAWTTNTLKIEGGGTNGTTTQTVALAGNLLTLTGNGLLSTGTKLVTITGTAGATRLTAGNGSGSYDLIIHQYNTGGLTIGAVIGNNVGNAVNLVKSGSSALTLTGANTYTGTTFLNAGTLILNNASALGGNNPGVNGTSGITMANGTTLQTPLTSGVIVYAPITTAGNVTINAPTTGTNTQEFKEFTLNGAIGGTGNVTFNNVNNTNAIPTVTLNAQSNYSGTTTIDNTAGTGGQTFVKLGIDNALPTTTVLNMLGQTGTGTGAGRAVELNLFGFDQTLAGLTNTSFGSLRAQRVVNSNASAAATLTINGSTNTTFSGNLGTNSANFSVNATAIPGSTNGNNFNLVKSGSGTFTLSGANTYSGGTTLSGGILQASNNTALGTVAVAFSGTGVRLVVDTGISLANNITIGTNSGVTGRGLIEAGTSTGTAIVSGDITINNGAAAGGHFSAPTANTILDLQGVITSSSVAVGQRAGTVMYSGGGTGYTALTLSQDTAKVGALNGIATTATITMGGSGAANLDLNGFNQSLVGIVKGVNGATIGNSSTATDSVLTTTGTSSFAGVIQDVLGSGTRKVALTVNGGVLTLSGTNTYSGATTIKAGTLALGAAGTFANSATVVVGDAGSSGTVLDLTAKSSFGFGSGQTVKGIGTINIGAGKTVTVAGKLAAGNSIGTITNTGNLALSGTLQSELGTPNVSAASGVSDRTVVSGDLNLTGSTLQIIDNAGANSQGSAGAGAYRLMTYGGTLTGTFGTITNPLSATLHEKVITGSGNVDLNLYRLATGSTGAVALGKARVGDTLTGSLTTTNSATADGFSEKLNASVGSNAGHVNASSGTVSGVIAGANASTINVGLSTATSGAKSGSVLVSYVSDGTGLNNYSTTANGSQTIAVTGDVYELATANFTQTAGATISGSGPSYTLDFGSGLDLDTLYTASFSIQNGVVVNSFIDTLSGGYSLTSGAFSTTAVDFSGLAAGAAANLFNIKFQTNSAGSYNGTFTFDGTSVQSGLDNVSVGDFTIALSATAVPEPNVAALLGGLGALALLRRRR